MKNDTLTLEKSSVSAVRSVGNLEQLPSIIFRNGDKKSLNTCFFNGESWEQNMPISDQVGHLDPTSSNSPSIVEYRGQLVTIYKGESSDNLYKSVFDGTSWHGTGKIDTMQSNKTPSLVVFQDRIYMVFKGKSSDTIYYASYDGAKDSWTDQLKISGVQSNYSPSLTVFNDKIFVIYKGKSSNKLYYVTFDGETWSKQKDISTGESNYTPAITTFNDQVFMVYKGKSSDSLYYGFFDDSGWSKQYDIPTSESNETPVIEVYNDKVLMVFKGKFSNTLYSKIFDGSKWSGQEKIECATSKMTPGLVVSSIVIRPDLAAGWDLVMAYKKGILNQKLEDLYENDTFPKSFSFDLDGGLSVQVDITSAPSFAGPATADIGSVNLNLPIKIQASKVPMKGTAVLTIDLLNINSEIQQISANTYSVSVDFSGGDLLTSIDLSQVSFLAQKLDGLSDLLLTTLNTSINELPSLSFNFKTMIPFSLNDTTIAFTYVQNEVDPTLSFLGVLIGLDGTKGSYNLSPSTIPSGEGIDSCYIVSNALIMQCLENVLYKNLRDNGLFVDDDFMSLSDSYPIVLSNNEDSEKFDFSCNASLKIDKGGLECYFNNDQELEIQVNLRYSEIIIGAWHTYHIKVYVSFSEAQNKLKVSFSNKIDSCSGGTTCKYIKKAVKDELVKFETLFTDGLTVTIPGFNVNNVLAPSYLRIAGEKSAS